MCCHPGVRGVTGKPLLPSHPKVRKAALRQRTVALIVLAVLMIAVPLSIYLNDHRPNLYDSARTDLLQASR
jgi:hypothetical protein